MIRNLSKSSIPYPSYRSKGQSPLKLLNLQNKTVMYFLTHLPTILLFKNSFPNNVEPYTGGNNIPDPLPTVSEAARTKRSPICELKK